ncbi:unnamed protein product [Amoebophrya sp. A120]|nr:unnamed protein product [Amoebophrya sp. A120]|eukprot:GSA120T00017404001.1
MAMIQAFLNRAPTASSRSLSVLSFLEKRTFTAAAAAATQKLPKVNQCLTNPLGSVRHAGASTLACGIATVALGGVAQGVGSVFAALVVGTARNPAIKDDLFAYTMIGFGSVELMMFIVIGLAVMLLVSE